MWVSGFVSLDRALGVHFTLFDTLFGVKPNWDLTLIDMYYTYIYTNPIGNAYDYMHIHCMLNLSIGRCGITQNSPSLG